MWKPTSFTRLLEPRSPDLPIIFLDTSALKFASERLIRGRVVPATAKWGGHEVRINVTQFVERYPNSKVDVKLAAEIRKLPFIAHLARVGRIRLTTHFETLWEFFGLPKTDDPRGRFYGAPIERAPDPFIYGRVVAGGTAKSVDHQFEFLRFVRHPRYDQLKTAVGASVASGRYRNQLLDAFHLLCAEAAQADYFLTLDFKLMRHVAGHRRWPPSVQLVRPSSLAMILMRRGNARVRDSLTFARHLARERSNPSDHPFEELVRLGKQLERSGRFKR